VSTVTGIEQERELVDRARRGRGEGAHAWGSMAMGEEEPAATTEIFGRNRKNAVESWEIPFHDGLGKLESVMECTHGMGRERWIMLSRGGVKRTEARWHSHVLVQVLGDVLT
jgi:hypothetical protein